MTTIDDFTWLVGHWQGTVDNDGTQDPVELAFSTPGAGAMCGFFRWLHDGAVMVYEFIELVPNANGALEMRLKHFKTGLIGWEEKDVYITFELISVEDQTARFSMQYGDGERHLIYHRVDEQTLTTEMSDQADMADKMVFSYSNSKP